jgi:ABC-2 type transport system permease protein
VGADRDLRSRREGGELSVPLYVQKYRSGEQTITVTVPRKPAHVLTCPYHLLIDRDPADTIAPLRTRE